MANIANDKLTEGRRRDDAALKPGKARVAAAQR